MLGKNENDLLSLKEGITHQYNLKKLKLSLMCSKLN